MEIVRLLLATGESNPRHVNIRGNTALIYASFEGHVEIVRLLLATGKSNPRHADDLGNTVLIIASREGHVEIVRIITRCMILERVRERRYKMFKAIRLWQQSVDSGKPGSNVFFYNMGQAIGQMIGLCSLEELREYYPDCSVENYESYITSLLNLK